MADRQLDCIVLDTETTGINVKQGAEVLQLSIIDGAGNTLFNEYFKPMFATEWPKAEKVNGITPAMVKDKPTIRERLPGFLSFFAAAKKIIGYNTPFDLGMLRHWCGIEIPEDTEVVDVMQDFSAIYREWNPKTETYKWQSLTTCAEYFGYDWGTDSAHDSLSDCRATLYCYQKLMERKS